MGKCVNILMDMFPENTLSKEELEAFESEILSVQKSGMTVENKQKEIKMLMEDGKLRAAASVQEDLNNSNIRNQVLSSVIEDSTKNRISIHSSLLSTFEGSRTRGVSVESLRDSFNSKVVTHIKNLRRENLLEAAESGEWDTQVSEVIHSFPHVANKGPDKDIINGLARIYMNMVEGIRVQLNGAGAAIAKDPQYVMPIRHNGSVIAEVPFEEWSGYLLERLDINRTFGVLIQDLEPSLRAPAIMDKLSSDYKSMIARYDSVKGYSVDTKEFSYDNIYGRKLIDRLNGKRVYHWKDGKSLFEYSQKFGQQKSIYSTLIDHSNDMASKTALLTMWGTDPKANIDKVLRKLELNTEMTGSVLEATKNEMYKALAISKGIHMDGGLDTKLSRIGALSRNIVTAAMLGKSAGSQFFDIVPTVLLSTNTNGRNVLSNAGESLSTWYRSIPSANRQEAADIYMREATEYMRQLRLEFQGLDHRPNARSSKMVTSMFKWTKLDTLTKIGKNTNSVNAMQDLKEIVQLPTLNQAQKNNVRQFGYTPEDMAVMKGLAEKDNLNPAYVLEILKDEKLYHKMHASISRREHMGVPTANSKTFRQMGLYNPKGTVLGETLRYVTQFKSTAWKATTDLFEISRMSSPDGKMQSSVIAQNFIGLTVLGLGVNYLKQIRILGDDDGNILPEFELDSGTVSRAIMSSGAGTLLGDFLAPILVEENTGSEALKSIGESAVGPVISQGVKIGAELSRGNLKKAAQAGIRTVPMSNMWFLLNVQKDISDILTQDLPTDLY